MPLPKGKNYKRFLDFQNDVAVSDIEIALKEGYRSIEHVKRYTTLGKDLNLTDNESYSRGQQAIDYVDRVKNYYQLLSAHSCVAPKDQLAFF